MKAVAGEGCGKRSSSIVLANSIWYHASIRIVSSSCLGAGEKREDERGRTISQSDERMSNDNKRYNEAEMEIRDEREQI